MADNEETVEFDDDGTESEDNVKGLRAAAKRSRENADRAKRLEREVAFMKAGIDTEAGTGKLLFQTYDGELTREAVLEYAKDYGIDPAAPAPEQTSNEEANTVSDPDAQALGQAQQNIGGDTVDPAQPSDRDPKDASWQAYQDVVQRGGMEEDGQKAYFTKLFGAAAEGD